MSDNTERRLGQFLLLVAAGHVLLGLSMPFVLPLLPGVLAQMPYAEAADAARFWSRVFGPTLASWGMLAFFIVRYGVQRRQRWACDALILAVFCWAPLDAWLCWQAGFPVGIVLDAIVSAALLVPALILRRRFPG
ncbi:hypothetical protein D0B54_00555 [Solimonas sp. K1W22B-7]|uniref:hypothetical protein n=1 Tax=Solimonas sp. K1W22B-7 TaxID=2303331 RepID=UPI000E332439|nr:hypothetical protein [Solimonas sp. K1W22B-7]AXQ27269.1 hypothetical protein D0B54_00555 [Solimonas sp. K1W22B-7]